MKRKKGRIILGTTAVAAALTLGGCSGGGNTAPQAGNTAEVTADTAVEAETAEAPQAAHTEEAAQEAKTEGAPQAAHTAETEQEAAAAETASEALTEGEPQNEENAGETIRDFEVFDPEDNYNVVVYGPPKDK